MKSYANDNIDAFRFPGYYGEVSNWFAARKVFYVMEPLCVLIISSDTLTADALIGDMYPSWYLPDWGQVQTADELYRTLKQDLDDLILVDYPFPTLPIPHFLAIYQECKLSIPIIMISSTEIDMYLPAINDASVHHTITRQHLQYLMPAIRYSQYVTQMKITNYKEGIA